MSRNPLCSNSRTSSLNLNVSSNPTRIVTKDRGKRKEADAVLSKLNAVQRLANVRSQPFKVQKFSQESLVSIIRPELLTYYRSAPIFDTGCRIETSTERFIALSQACAGGSLDDLTARDPMLQQKMGAIPIVPSLRYVLADRSRSTVRSFNGDFHVFRESPKGRNVSSIIR